MSSESLDHRWTACPPGSVRGIVRRVRTRRRNARLREATMMVVCATVIGFAAGYLALPDAKPPASMGPFHFAGISCDDVRSLLPALMANRLDADTATKVRQHIMECPECGRLMKEMQSTHSVSQSSKVSTVASLASSRFRPLAGKGEL